MRRANHYGIVLSVVICIICFLSCSKEYSSPLKGQTVSNQVFETGTNTKTIIIGKDDLSKCTITSSADWCSASIQGSSVTISVQPNDTYDERQATITLTDPEDDTTLSFTVIQNQNDAILVDNNTFKVPEEGGMVNIQIESNVDYEVELPVEGWITIQNGTRGLKKSNLSLKVALNDSGSAREGIVRIINNATGIYNSILIKQALTPRVKIDPNTISVDQYGNEITVNVKSNVSIANIATNKDWIIIGEKKNIDKFNFSITIKIMPMSNEYSRSGQVSFNSSNGSSLSLLSINQQLNEILSVDKTQISTDYKGGEYYLTVKSNVGWSFENNSYWIHMSRLSYNQQNNGQINEYPYKVIIDPNDSEGRNGTIKIQGKTKEITVRVNQAGNPNPNIKKYIKSYTHVVFHASGFAGSTLAYAYIQNNSPYTIYLNQVEMYTTYNGNILVEYFNSKPLSPGLSFNVTFGEHFPTLRIEGLGCRWKFTYNGKEYTVIGKQD